MGELEDAGDQLEKDIQKLPVVLKGWIAKNQFKIKLPQEGILKFQRGSGES